jgi:putative acetyltransferase
VIIRDEGPRDADDIRSFVSAAFGRADEATLIDDLRSAGDLAISLVAVDGGVLIGHVAFSPVRAPFRALALGPVAVEPAQQGKGVGSGLIREGLRRAIAAGVVAVFVLGDPGYYQRFGFSVERAAGFSSPYAGAHFMILTLSAALPVLHGRIDHASAFQHLP